MRSSSLGPVLHEYPYLCSSWLHAVLAHVWSTEIYHSWYKLSRLTIGASTIARLYHSVSLMIDDGSIIIFGSTPNADSAAVGTDYPNEKRIEVDCDLTARFITRLTCSLEL